MSSSLSSGRPASPTVPDHPASSGEVYDCPRFCGMFDGPYVARYRRDGTNRFHLVGTVKGQASAWAGNGSAAPFSLRFDQIDSASAEERCAWCGAKGFVQCGKCNHMLCTAKVTKRGGGRYFRCKCGHEGMLSVVLETFDGSRGTAPPSKAASVGTLPGSDRLRLKS